MKKKLVGLAVTTFLGFAAATAAASSWVTYEFTYPGVACNAFGAAGTGPNGGTYLSNWSNPASVLVSCPFMHDATVNEVANAIRVDVVGNTTCVVAAESRSGGNAGTGWWYANASAITTGGPNTYTEFTWTQQMFTLNGDIDGTAIQCSIPEGSSVEQYRVNGTFQSL